MQQCGVYVIDRFSGHVQFCTPRECNSVGSGSLDEYIKNTLKPDNQTYEEWLRGKKADSSQGARSFKWTHYRSPRLGAGRNPSSKSSQSSAFRPNGTMINVRPFSMTACMR